MRTFSSPEGRLGVGILHIFVVSAFAVAQPLFDVLARYPEFLVASGATPGDIGWLILCLMLALPVTIGLVVVILEKLGRGLGRWVQVFALGGLASVLTLSILNTTRASMLLVLLVTLGAGIVFSAAYLRFRFMAGALSFMSVTLILFPVLFLLRPPIQELVFPTQSTRSYPVIDLEESPPIIVVVFDELNSIALMNEARVIDAVRYPNFARLAARSYWFRNATTVSEQTVYAVPALVSGQRPVPGEKRLATAAEFPNSLFSVLAGSYRLSVREPITRLCPPDLDCDRNFHVSRKQRVLSLISDVSVIFLHLLTPEEFEASLPSISHGWRGFAGVVTDEGRGATSEQRAQAGLRQRFEDFHRFVASIEPTDEPTLYFLHVLLPHAPFECVTGGGFYGRQPMPGLTGGKWEEDEVLVTQAMQRYLLQVGCVDTLLGELIQRLEKLELYDRSLLIVTSDHGSSFRPGNYHRRFTRDNHADIMSIPLFIKLPRQKEPRISDRNVELLDVLPSVADVLGAELPFPVDGVSFFGVGAEARPSKRLYQGEADQEFEFSMRFEEKWNALERQLSYVGSGESRPHGLYTFGLGAEVAGQPVSQLPRRIADGVSVVLDRRSLLERVDLDGRSGFYPVYLSGNVGGGRLTAEPLTLAIGVNGGIEAVTRTSSDGRQRFRAMIPVTALRQGSNSIEVYRMEVSSGGEWVLARIEEANRRGFELEASGQGWSLTTEAGERFPVSGGSALGSLDVVELKDNRITFSGWAFDPGSSRPADEILVFYQGNFLDRGSVVHIREDVARRYGEAASRSGFSFSLPIAVMGVVEYEQIEVYAKFNDKILQLPKNAQKILRR